MRILLVAGRYPFPPRRGDQLRSLQCATALASLHQVTLLVPEAPAGGAPVPRDLPFAVETCSRRRSALPWAVLGVLRSGLPLQNALFCYPALGERLAGLLPENDLVVLQLVRLAALLPAIGDAPLVVDLIDSLSLNVERRARRDRPWLRPLYAAEARRIARCEERLLARAGCGLVVSDRDRRDLERRLPPQRRLRLRTVPIAVDAATIDGSVAPGGSASDSDSVVFTGNFGYFVNRDGLRWFLETVWPGLHRARPRLRLVAAGSRASRALRRDLERGGGELVEDPSDLRAVLGRATLAVAPLQCGSGVPIKVLEAWSVGTPVVASSWGAAGVEGENALVVADDPRQWIDAVVDLLDSPQRREALAAEGRRSLARSYSTEAVRRGFLDGVELAWSSRNRGGASGRE